MRPDVVWFGEMLPAPPLEAAFEATHGCDIFFSVGTSNVVQPAASLPFEALRDGAVIVEVNPNATPLTRHAHYAVRGQAAAVLPALVRSAYR